MRFTIGPVAVAFCTGCASSRPLKPGAAVIHSGMATNSAPEFRSELKQPENPAQSAAQNYERTTETELPLATGTKVTETVATRDERGQPVTREKVIVLVEQTIYIRRHA